MLGAVRSSVARTSRSAARQVRKMSSNPVIELQEEMGHAAKETSKWRLITFGCIPLCAGLAALTLSNVHHHHRNAPPYPYMLYKVKDFPWGPDPLLGIPK